MRSRKGTSLVEALVMLVPALLILGAALLLLTRSAVHDGFNDARLSSLDAALIANERLQTDLAAGQAGRIEADGETLVLEAVSAKGRTERASYALRRGALTRNDAPIRAAQLKSAAFQRDGAVLTMTLTAGDVPVRSTTHLVEQSARETFGSWGRTTK